MFKYLLGCCFLAISTFGFAEQHTWYFVRHFEKHLGDNPSLTEIGKARAEALAVFFRINLLIMSTRLFTIERWKPPLPLQYSKIYQ